MTQGFFSLIQYCPDASRAEAANVGLMLFREAPAAVVVRVVDDARPVVRRLGRRDDPGEILDLAHSMRYRLEHEEFGDLAQLEKFVRTRGNEIQLTMPRPMRIEAIEQDADRMFAELVTAPQAVQIAAAKEPTLLRRTFQALRERLPDRVFVAPEFHVRRLEIPVRADFAWQNGCLNLVREMPASKDSDRLRLHAMGLSKEGELVTDLVEGHGRLIVVAPGGDVRGKQAEREEEFGGVLKKLGHASFVPSHEVGGFLRTVEAELGAH